MRSKHTPPLDSATLTAVQTLPIYGPWPTGESEVELRNSTSGKSHSDRTGDAHKNAPLFEKNGTPHVSNATNLKLNTEQGFVAGPENELAIEAVTTLSDFLGTNYNPLLIGGLPGTGKSHLARGLAKVWQKKLQPTANSTPTILVFSGSEFVVSYHNAVNQERQREFQNRVRRVQLLVIDELSQMASKTTALQELKATIDELLASGGHLIVTSRLPIEMIPGINSALLARLTGGLAISLKIPGPEARFVLWERYTAAQGIAVSEAILQSLAVGLEITAADIWQMIGSLAAESETGRQIAEREAKSVLQQQRVAYQPTVRAIANLCAKYYGLKPNELTSPVRRRTIVTARNMAIYLARTMSGLSLEQLGKHFGGRDHTTVLHGFRTIENRLKTEPETKQAYEDLRKMLAQR